MDWSLIKAKLDVLNGGTYWVLQVFIVVLFTLIVSLIARSMIRRFHRHLSKTKNVWDDAIVEASEKPVGVLIWLFGFTFALEVIESATNAVIFQAIGPIRDVCVIAIVAWFLIRFIRFAESQLLEKSEHGKVDETTVDAIAKLLRLSVFITMTLVALQTLGYSISGVLAFGGIGGLAVGLASKDLLSNFFGGLMLYLDRPFVIGDWIRSKDREIEGTVEAIGWRLTQIRTFDKRPLYVPNSVFANIAVENPSRMTNRRIYETIGIRYNDIGSMQTIVDEVKSMLTNHFAIDTSQTLMVNFNAFNASSVDFFVYAFTKTTNWIEFHQIKQEILLKISEIITSHGAEIAFPTSTVHMADPVELHFQNQERLDFTKT